MSTENLHIVPVLLKDNKKLLEIGYQTFYDSFGPPVNKKEDVQDYLNKKFTLRQINYELRNPNSKFYFAILDTHIVGYLKINYGDSQTEKLEGNALEIERIYVIKRLQSRKVGQYLFEKALHLAHERSIEFIWLGVWKENTKAIKFYERNGFKSFTEHQFILGTSVQTDLMMKLIL